METAQLKSFATAARTELIREVTARITVVLAQGSPERVEQPKAVTALERAIAGGGGGDKGKAHVADKVAYTWFNRIIALRFMDANGYTGIGVVSPAAEQVGQPEVLAAAKRGQVDKDVVKGTNPATITGLLNGTRQPRRGANAQAEAYSLLLADYCRYWNAAMPFMFEREGDYTELLIPANLLADDSVLSRSGAVLTGEVCQDVEVIGWLYQFYISERKDEVFAGFKKNKKAGADEIPAATQLFTPHWIVRYLLENSLGRLWMLNRPNSRLVSQMDYYIASVDEETDFLKIDKPEELKVIDPACGSGHMLTYAFDLLYAIYEEEGYAPSEIPGLILTNNLYGTEIDPRAGALAAFALTMKAVAKRKLFLKNPVEPNICVLDPISFTPAELDYLVTKDGDRHAEEAFWNQFAEADTLGSLVRPDPALVVRLGRHLGTVHDGGDMYRADSLEWALRVVRQAELLVPAYSVVVANPPYMGAKSMDRPLADFARNHYRDSRSDLFAMFIERCVDLTVPSGMVGMITMQSWMFGSSLAQFRGSLLATAAIRTMAHLGSGAFDTISGEVVSTTAFTLEKARTPIARTGAFLDVTGPNSEAGKQAGFLAVLSEPGRLLRVAMSSLAEIPGQPIAYWASSKALSAFKTYPPVSAVADLKAGISTGDNTTYERQWHEVSWSRVSGPGSEEAVGTRRWTPCNSGGRFRRWYGNNDTLMDWEDDGRRIRAHQGSAVRNPSFMGRSGLTYSKIGGARFAVRSVPAGFVFDDTGRMIFPKLQHDLLALAALLNSSTAQYFLDLMSPGLTFTSNEIGKIPWAPLPTELATLASKATEIARSDWDSTERSWDFRSSPLLTNGHSPSRTLADSAAERAVESTAVSAELRAIEEEMNAHIAGAYGLDDVVESSAAIDTVALPSSQLISDAVRDLVSYAVGCMFGRYSLDEPGLVLADQGSTVQDYLARVPSPTFTPDADNVIPVVEGDWFEDDVAGLFRQFLRAAFGERNFEENLRFVTQALGVKNLRDYFITRAGKSKFYDDHVQRYKKRPIYWLFSSPKGSFNALIYMHRYTPSTVSTVLTYLREYVTKLESSLQQAERVGNAKEADRLRKILVELNEYEHDTLYPKASENVAIDLDDGVKTNYPKLGAALKKIAGLEASGE
jgi:hypothetical protein